ncbi:MAG TPA: NAD(P)/FAD-dependent oxidoreductase [Gaiella sp.]|jgi:NADH dehydrogenase|nr:NAD(P)/FAD-dependent oxidoreductase [Gaiella sp.]
MIARREAAGGTLVVGGGFAGSYVARLLGRRGATIVNPDNFMLYTPLLAEAAAGTLEPRHVVVPIRQMCPHAELLLGRVVSHDPKAASVVAETLGGTFEIGYERMVVALGSVPRTFPVPGLREHGHGFKDLADAIDLRNRLLRALESAAARLDNDEAARDLSFVFVGAGYAGVEALAELHDLAHAAVRRFYPTLRDVRQRWVLVDAAPKILPEIPRKLGEYTHRELEKRGVEIHVSTTLESFDGGEAVLSNGTRVPARTLVWAAGVRPSPDVARLELPLDDRGRVVVDETLAVAAQPRVWALGDCAAVPNARTPGQLDPPTCQHALRQARRLAKNLTGPPKPYAYRMLGQVATLGRYKGIAELPGMRLRGFPGWFVARTYHLYALPTLRRKARVVTDWTVSLFFRRDIAELSTLGHPRSLGDE